MKNALAVLCLVPALAWGAEKAPKAPPRIPGVDWQARTIRATGRGAPRLNAPSIAAARIGAEKAAEMDALRNILSVVKGLQLTGDKKVGDAMAADDELRATVEGQVKNFRRVDTRYFNDGGVEIDVEMPREDLLPELAPEASAPALPREGALVHTGLIIDARGLKAQPALLPRVLDEEGKELYSASVVTKEALKTQGIAGYLKNVDEATRSARVGERPRGLKAVRLGGGSARVLGAEDAAKLRDPKSNLSYLGEGRVIVVAD